MSEPSRYCKRCHKLLKTPESMNRGYGPKCWMIIRREVRRSEQNYIDYPMAEFVILKRLPDGTALTNVPRVVVHHSPDGFEWGYEGSGPADLALNILENLTPKLGIDKKNLPRIKCWKGTCYLLAWQMHQKFKREWIATVQKAGTTYPVQEIVDWMSDIINQPRSEE